MLNPAPPSPPRSMTPLAWMRLTGYHVRLALRSLRRDLALSLAMFFCLAIGSGMWTTILSHLLREYPFRPALPPGLTHVELQHPRGLALSAAGTSDRGWQARTRVTFPEYRILADSGIPTRQAASFRSRVLLAGAAAGGAARAAPQIRNARFATAGLFDLFPIPVGAGRAYSRNEESRLEPVAVISRVLAGQLFGTTVIEDPARAVGQTLQVEGQPFTVVGVVTDDQPFRPEWDIAATGDDQDMLYLPLPWAQRLQVSPARPLLQSPLAPPRGETIWRSDAIFVSYWAELLDPAARAAYAGHLARRFGPRGTGYQLRSLADWQRAFPPVESDVVFFTFLLALGLAGAGFSAARLLLAKGLARRDQIGLHRALGATRATLFVRQMIEAALIAFPAALFGVPFALAFNRLFNGIAVMNDIPVKVDLLSAALGAGVAFLVGLLAAAYPTWRLAQTSPAVTLGRT